jgi:hypothetical protein
MGGWVGWVGGGMGGWVSLRVGFININDMYDATVINGENVEECVENTLVRRGIQAATVINVKSVEECVENSKKRHTTTARAWLPYAAAAAPVHYLRPRCLQRFFLMNSTEFCFYEGERGLSTVCSEHTNSGLGERRGRSHEKAASVRY